MTSEQNASPVGGASAHNDVDGQAAPVGAPAVATNAERGGSERDGSKLFCCNCSSSGFLRRYIFGTGNGKDRVGATNKNNGVAMRYTRTGFNFYF